MANIFSTICVVISSTVLSLAVIKINSAQAIQIIPPGYQVEEISTGSFELVQPTGLAIDINNNIYIGRNLFTGTSDLLKINAAGETSSIASFNGFIGGLAINNDGQIFASFNRGGAFDEGKVFMIQDGNISEFATGLPPTLEQLVFDQENNLFVASFGGQAVSKVSPEGIATTIVSGLGGPFGVAFKDESLFIGDNLNGGNGLGNGPGILKEVTSQGIITDFFASVPGRIVDLEYEPISDSFFIANQGSNFGSPPGRIDVLNNGQINAFAIDFPEVIDSYPRDIEFDSNGNLYVLDSQKLYKISKTKLSTVPEPNSVLSLLAFSSVSVSIALRKKLASLRKSN